MFSIVLYFSHYFCLTLIMILTAVPDCHRSTPPNYLELSLKEILNGCKRNIAYHCEKYWRKGREILVLIMILTVVPDCHRPTPPNYPETHPFKCRQRITEPYYWSISQMYLLRLSYLFVQIFKCICPKSKMCLFKFSSPPPEESSLPIGRLAANQRQVYNDRKWICQKVT